MKYRGMISVVVVLAAMVVFTSAYVVNETEQAVVTQFGKVVGTPVTEPGLKFKVPFVQKANFFPKNLMTWDGDPGQIPTLDKTYIWVDTFARWKIVEPVKFFQTVGNLTSALGRLDDIIDPAVRNLVTSFSLLESVRKSNREMELTLEEGEVSEKTGTKFNIETGREKITRMIMEQAQPKLVAFGIELVDVKIKRINYVEQVRKSVYGRMVAERNQIAEKYRSEGLGEAQKVRGEKERELKRITSGAYRKAQVIKGEADATATKIFADAYGVDPEFYSFVKTLEVYSQTLDEKSSLILSTNAEFLKYLKRRD